MQKNKLFILITVAIIMALGAVTMANKLMSNRLQIDQGEQTTAGKQVIVAVSDIAYAQVIQENDIALKALPEHWLPSDAITSPDDVVGKVSRGDIFQGELLLARKLADSHSGAILASLVEQAMRAVTVRVDDVTGVAGFLLPGNRVDVLGSRMEKSRSLTRTVLENIRVLAVDQTVEANKDEPVLVRAVTLEVSPEDSEQLFQAMQEGTIHLTLRNPSDAGTKITLKPDDSAAEQIESPVTPPTSTQDEKPAEKKSVASKPQPRKSKVTAPAPQIQQAVVRRVEPLQTVVTTPVFMPPEPEVATKTITVIRGTHSQDVTLIDTEGSPPNHGSFRRPQ